MTTGYQYATSQPGTKQFATLQAPSSYPLIHAIYFNTTSIVLHWTAIKGVSNYQIQVSEMPDFSGTLLVDSVVTGPSHSFTDTGTNDTKRWWRARTAGASGYGEWQEKASYWINTAGAESVNCGRGIWRMFNPDDVTDMFVIPLFPENQITEIAINRFKDRNRKGLLLSEYVTSKVEINFNYQNNGFIDHYDFRAFRRFNEVVKTFFIATFKDSEIERPVPNIWKVQFSLDPVLSMVSMGRPDIMVGTLNFVEV